ncbi:RNA polymerase, sigma 54 subunit, RpoN [Chloroherpeton thalassium ATCC 35110]|uniref:RNA polymerase, sigma 54 subunit, RpoN n=1 Tax=Chloroherpeton thalassium (strain ATCC 35110 / GB-78) TaxID=517418 RepID=B3QT08_CHLT3|nr:RNA polymerase factor sigma-54 [Chloroherpeton thalassium]ACF12651.1 RNA polymerase, sigma 54 subunit, RpoN [Chloroherpeton thalassium ATCC 35110]
MNTQSLSQRQVQTMRLSPQQLLYTKLLQLPLIQLEQRVKQELEENPMLEEFSESDEEAGQPEEMATDLSQNNDDENKLNEKSEQNEEDLYIAEKPTKDEPLPKDDDYTKEFDQEIEEYFPDGDEEGFNVPSFREEPSDESYFQPVFHESFTERVLNDLRYQDVTEKELAIAEEIVGNIDEDGYLRCPIEVIADGLMTTGIEVTEAEILKVLEKIWYIDPVGIGARNLQECLLIQLEAKYQRTEDIDDTLYEQAKLILNKYYHEFTMKHFEKLMTLLSISPEELTQALLLIQSFNPKPGGDVSASSNYIIPDFIVTFDGKNLVAFSNERNSFQIRISEQYKPLLEDKSQPKGAKEFVRNKYEAAKNFMTAIEMRRQTLQRVMNALLNLQYEFFTIGPNRLKPMILKDVAEVAGVDISTVSRVVNGKYVQAHKGILELKYFFSTGLETESGDEISNKLIKEKIKSFIEKEDTRKPLSDDKISEMLQQNGFKVARRTVAKYREQMNIPVARLRKQIQSLK